MVSGAQSWLRRHEVNTKHGQARGDHDSGDDGNDGDGDTGEGVSGSAEWGLVHV